MTTTQITLEEPADWSRYLVLLLIVSTVIWFGFRASRDIRALLLLRQVRGVVQAMGGPKRAITFTALLSSLFDIMMFVGGLLAIWGICINSMCAFREIELSDACIHLTYDITALDRELPIGTIRNIELSTYGQKTFLMNLTTKSGRLYRSVLIDDAYRSQCQRMIDLFRKARPNSANAGQFSLRVSDWRKSPAALLTSFGSTELYVLR